MTIAVMVCLVGALANSGFRGPVAAEPVGVRAAAITQSLIRPAIPYTLTAPYPVRAAVHRRPLAITDVTVIDIRTGRLLSEQTVIIIGSRIRTVGATTKVRLPRDAQVVDGRGKYLVPGLWDMHMHVWEPEFLAPLLAAGVTGYLDMWAPHRIDTVRQWQREIAAGTRLGPRWLTPGRPIQPVTIVQRVRAAGDTGVPGSPPNPDIFLAAATPAEARQVVDSLKRLGVDFIKNHDDAMSRATYFALMAEARRVKIPVTGHLPTSITPMEASDSGQRSIAHVYGYNDDGPCQPSDSASGKDERCTAMMAKFIRNGTWMITTADDVTAGVLIVQNIVRASRQLAVAAPLLAGTDQLLALPFRKVDGQSLRSVYEGVYEAMFAAIHRELEVLVQGGLTPLEALQTATVNPALYLNATDSLGTVAAGKVADLIVLDANPLVDIKNTRTIRAVVANGRYLDRARLDSLMVPPDTTELAKPTTP